MREKSEGDTRRTVLVVDDEPALRLVARAVLGEAGWEVREAGSAEEALDLLGRGLGREVNVVLLDMRMPGMDGLAALPLVRRAAPGAAVVMLTAYGAVGSAVEAMKQGAFDYLSKPADNEELAAVLGKAYEYTLLLKENRELRERLAGDGAASGFIGQSPAAQRVRDLIEQAGPSEATVLILGESGTGKELVAQGLHLASQRRDFPLVKVNCAALPGELLESELFGYVKGAFTGAAKDKPGRFQLAHGGTLFLDEVGDLPLSLQAKLLRAIQERVVEPLGSVRPAPTDVRLLAATNRDLAAEVAAGRFREDLFFRLNVLEVRIPPLRERAEDIPLLAAHLLARLAAKNRRPEPRISPRFLEALSRYPWPGNVRELENALERALILSRTDTLRPDDLPPQVADPALAALRPGGPASAVAAPPAAASPPSLEEAERQALLAALDAHAGHRQKTADALGISRRTLQYKLKKFGLLGRDEE
ncbi:MAG: sigma-54 dependent transcriptional regulator [Thermodesulfobacteriota bacterium]